MIQDQKYLLLIFGYMHFIKVVLHFIKITGLWKNTLKKTPEPFHVTFQNNTRKDRCLLFTSSSKKQNKQTQHFSLVIHM